MGFEPITPALVIYVLLSQQHTDSYGVCTVMPFKNMYLVYVQQAYIILPLGKLLLPSKKKGNILKNSIHHYFLSPETNHFPVLDRLLFFMRVSDLRNRHRFIDLGFKSQMSG